MADIYVGSEGQHWVLHEKLLCHHSPVLRGHFYKKGNKSSMYGLPDENEEAFKLLVGWLYSATLHFPLSENEIGPLLDLYLLAEHLQMAALEGDVVDTVRAYYQHNNAYPGLRRVQYIYANTEQDNPMREMMVGSVARQLTLSDSIPKWWANALKKNGQLAVDIIRAIQEWHLDNRSVPDVRETRDAMGFSTIGDNEGRSEYARSEYAKSEHNGGADRDRSAAGRKGSASVPAEQGTNGSMTESYAEVGHGEDQSD